jgi:hypothetical protein
MNLKISGEDKGRAKIFEKAMRFAWKHDAPHHQTPVFHAWKYMMQSVTSAANDKSVTLLLQSGWRDW